MNSFEKMLHNYVLVSAFLFTVAQRSFIIAEQGLPVTFSWLINCQLDPSPWPQSALDLKGNVPFKPLECHLRGRSKATWVGRGDWPNMSSVPFSSFHLVLYFSEGTPGYHLKLQN